uniref:Uncharacterized protein n=1 Tax=viral metagenome TaxID=1070528 RepID=A0A6H2A2K5_9ZZZZ
MATTHDATSQAAFVGAQPAWGTTGDGYGKFSVMKFHVDMGTVTTALAATVDGSAADVIQLWDIPAGTQILGCRVNVTTAEGAAATVTVGDGTNPAGYLAAFSINAVADKMTLLADAYGAAARTYTDTDTLDLVFATDTDIDTAVFDVYVACIFYTD